MGYKKPSYILQTWWVIKYAVNSWLEWLDAKSWAKVYRPAWVQIATKAECEETRTIYRNKILCAYKRAEDGK